MYTRPNSHCHCCFDCSKHDFNERQKYIIPCADRHSCVRYQEHLAKEKEAHERAKQERLNEHYYSESEYHRRTARDKK